MKEYRDLWETLKEAQKPIVIYGMGDGCDKILGVCREKGIPIQGIFASDEYVRPKTIHGFPLKSLKETKAELGEVIALLAFGVFRPDLMQQIQRIGEETELYAPEVPLFGGGLFDEAYYRSHSEELETVRSLLADEFSREVFDGLVEYKLTGRIPPLRRIESSREQDLMQLIPYQKGDFYLDLGAYDGDTAAEWAALHPDYGRITAWEPNEKSFRKMLLRCEALSSFEPLPYASWNRREALRFNSKTGRSASVTETGNATVEAIAPDEITARADFIKMDVEGAEKETIEGCTRLIREQKPSLCISAYHRTEDLFAIPLQVLKIRSDYRVYLRHTPYVPAWDTFYYFSR